MRPGFAEVHGRGADIYAVDIEGIQGCLAVERMTSDQVLMKELLLPEDLLILQLNNRSTTICKGIYSENASFLGEHLRRLHSPFRND